MAFVYEEPRWKKQSCNQKLGPGYYNQYLKKQPKMGIITPQNQTKRHNIAKREMQLQHEHSERKFSKQKKGKLIHRSQNAKNRQAKSNNNQCNSNIQTDIKPQILSDSKSIFLEITNTANSQKKSFQNSIIKTSFKKAKRSIHSFENNAYSSKPLFNDKILRNCKKTVVNQEPSLLHVESNDYFQVKIKRNNQLKKFISSSEKQSKKQNNFFSAKNSPSFNQKSLLTKQNFIIASQNCKRTKFISKSTSKLESKRTILYQQKQQQCNNDMQTTRVYDSDEDSMEYIQEATPGPGQYQLRKQKQHQISCVQSFGVTQKRFFQNNNQSKKLNLLKVEIPNFKKTTKASQQKVAFGKVRPLTCKERKYNLIFYDDLKSIENKCMKNLMKNMNKPAKFLSTCNRFEKDKKPFYEGPDFFDHNQQEKIILPNSIFMSKVERQQYQMSPTAEIDYQGQEYKTIKKELEKSIEDAKFLEVNKPGFCTSNARFNYKEDKQNEQCPIFMNSPSTSKQCKAFTFSKNNKDNFQKIANQTPAPWEYSNNDSKWIKPSHHIRYKF